MSMIVTLFVHADEPSSAVVLGGRDCETFISIRFGPRMTVNLLGGETESPRMARALAKALIAAADDIDMLQPARDWLT